MGIPLGGIWCFEMDNLYTNNFIPLGLYHSLDYEMSIFGFMHKFWTIPTVNITYISFWTYTSMVVGEHGIQTFKVVVVVLFAFGIVIWCFCPHKCTSLSFLDKQFVQIYFNVSSLHPNLFEISCGTTIYSQKRSFCILPYCS